MNIEKKSLWTFFSPLFSKRARSIALLLAMCLASLANAQEKSEPPAAGVHAQHPSPHPATADEEERFPEVEFVASSKFRSFSYLQPVYRGLNFEGHYFDVEDNDVGAINGSWTFRLREGIKLSPGFGERRGSSPVSPLHRHRPDNPGGLRAGTSKGISGREAIPALRRLDALQLRRQG